jgi:hypothetical protein
MEFGDRQRFSIQINRDNSPLDEWINGGYCYWVFENMVGDIYKIETLRDVLIQMDEIKQNYGGYRCCGRFCPKLFELPGDRIYELIRGAIYIGEPYCNEIFNYLPSEDFIYENFSVWPDVNPSWNVFLIDGKDKSKLLYKNILDDNTEVKCVLLERGEFDSILLSAWDYLEALLDEASLKKQRGGEDFCGAKNFCWIERTEINRRAMTKEQICQQLLLLGNRVVEVVFGYKGDSGIGHAFIVLNQNGEVKFLDKQTGMPAQLEGFDSFYLPMKKWNNCR